MDKLTVLVGKQRDGYVFRLKPSSKRELEQEGDSRDTVSSIFISYDTKHDFEQIQGTDLGSRDHITYWQVFRGFESIWRICRCRPGYEQDTVRFGWAKGSGQEAEA